MGDLISRQAAIDAMAELQGRASSKGELTGISKAWKRIKQLPPIQPEPKRGKWIHHPEIGWGETWLCDQCGEKTTSAVMGKPRANFCPNCGAKMEGTNGN